MASEKTENLTDGVTPLGKLLIGVGALLLALSLGIVFLTFFPLLKEELRYQTRTKPAERATPITPIDSAFGIIIPKLGANARIIANVDPYDSAAYQSALARGVAHARGTVFPGQPGNVFLFSHSSVDFYRATQFNSIFYLINKLETDDPIDLYYKGTKYTYRVTGKNIVESTAVSYLTAKGSAKTLTLMTCWPPGTSLRRLMVFAQITEQ